MRKCQIRMHHGCRMIDVTLTAECTADACQLNNLQKGIVSYTKPNDIPHPTPSSQWQSKKCQLFQPCGKDCFKVHPATSINRKIQSMSESECSVTHIGVHWCHAYWCHAYWCTCGGGGGPSSPDMLKTPVQCSKFLASNLAHRPVS